MRSVIHTHWNFPVLTGVFVGARTGFRFWVIPRVPGAPPRYGESFEIGGHRFGNEQAEVKK